MKIWFIFVNKHSQSMYNKSVQRKIMWFAHKMALIGLQYGQRSYKIGLQGIHPNVVQFALNFVCRCNENVDFGQNFDLFSHF